MCFNEIHDLVIDFLFENEVRKALNVCKGDDIKVAIFLWILKNIFMNSEKSSTAKLYTK